MWRLKSELIHSYANKLIFVCNDIRERNRKPAFVNSKYQKALAGMSVWFEIFHIRAQKQLIVLDKIMYKYKLKSYRNYFT